uniref:Pv-fam-g protein n=1 Tax=Strongyloides papillosus TaxID=174720 RepID=A0A0N5BCB2_STREA
MMSKYRKIEAGNNSNGKDKDNASSSFTVPETNVQHDVPSIVGAPVYPAIETQLTMPMPIPVQFSFQMPINSQSTIPMQVLFQMPMNTQSTMPNPMQVPFQMSMMVPKPILYPLPFYCTDYKGEMFHQ